MNPFPKLDTLVSLSSECSYLSRVTRRLKPEAVFLYFALVFGCSVLVIMPPFQAPDEEHHFFRAYQVSEGIMLGNHFEAELLPKSLKLAWQATSRLIPGDLDRKITPATILSAFQIPLNPDDRSVHRLVLGSLQPTFLLSAGFWSDCRAESRIGSAGATLPCQT